MGDERHADIGQISGSQSITGDRNLTIRTTGGVHVGDPARDSHTASPRTGRIRPGPYGLPCCPTAPSCLAPEELREAEALADEDLEGHALGLSLAGAYLRKVPSVGFAAYRDKLRE